MTKPIKIQLEKGKTYSLCTCGKSKNTPFCDGTHKGTLNRPHVVTPEETKMVSLCGCYQSNNKPYCDGAHKAIAMPACPCNHHH